MAIYSIPNISSTTNPHFNPSFFSRMQVMQMRISRNFIRQTNNSNFFHFVCFSLSTSVNWFWTGIYLLFLHWNILKDGLMGSGGLTADCMPERADAPRICRNLSAVTITFRNLLEPLQTFPQGCPWAPKGGRWAPCGFDLRIFIAISCQASCHY